MSNNVDANLVGGADKAQLIRRFLDPAYFQATKRQPKLQIEDVPVPEFEEGAIIRVQELGAGVAQDFGTMINKEDAKFAMPLWIIASARAVNVDGTTGEPIFTDTPETREMLLNWGGALVMKIGQAALRVNGMLAQQAEAFAKN